MLRPTTGKKWLRNYEVCEESWVEHFAETWEEDTVVGRTFQGLVFSDGLVSTV